MRFLYLILLCGLAFGPVFQPNFAQAAARPDQNPIEVYRNMSELGMLASDLHGALLGADRALLRHVLERDMDHLYEVEQGIRHARELTRRADAIAIFDAERHQFRYLDQEVEQLRLPGRSVGGLKGAWDFYESKLAPMIWRAADQLDRLAEVARQGENLDLLYETAAAQRDMAGLAFGLARYMEGQEEGPGSRVMEYLSYWDQGLEKMTSLAKNEAERRLLAELAQLGREARAAFLNLREARQTFHTEAREFRNRLESLLGDTSRLSGRLNDSARQAGLDLLIQEHARPPFDGRI